jgi:hypothetical protein
MMLAVTNDAAAKLVAVLEEFRKIDPQLSLQAMMTFVAIARRLTHTRADWLSSSERSPSS